MTTFRTYLCAALFTLLPASLMAWGPIGHMSVDYVAYQRLTPATKARVRDLLKLNPWYSKWEAQIPAGTSPAEHDQIIFMIAATWSDDIKDKDSGYSDEGPDPNVPDGATSSQNIGYADLFRHRYWHFVDTPFSPDHTALPPVPTPNAETEIAVFRAVLNSAQPDELKSYDLVWLLHLVGDVHQPLHATTRVTQPDPQGDAGGNKVKLSGDASSNLHSYWDDLPGFDSAYCKEKIPCVDKAIQYGKSLKSASSSAAQQTSAAVWIQESLRRCRPQFGAETHRAGRGEAGGSAEQRTEVEGSARVGASTRQKTRQKKPGEPG
jgi:S1/P1 Nuclease